MEIENILRKNIEEYLLKKYSIKSINFDISRTEKEFKGQVTVVLIPRIPLIKKSPNDIANEIIGDNYLRINSMLGKINRVLDDDSDENLEKIHKLGLNWWEEFGEETINFIND